MAANKEYVNLENLRKLANSDLLKDQLVVYSELKRQKEVDLANKINNLTREYYDLIDERRFFIGELEKCLPTNVMAYKTRNKLKRQEKDDRIRALEMRSTTLQLRQEANKGLYFFRNM